MASKASRNGVQGAESALFAADFEAFPLRVGVVDLVQSIRWVLARRIGGDSAASDSAFAPKSHPGVRHEKTRRPVRRTNPAPRLFQMARATSQTEEHGAESASFAAGFEAFPLRVGVVDRPQSTACGPARRFAGDSAAGVAQDSGLTQVLRYARQSPATKRRAGLRHERIQHRGSSEWRGRPPKMEFKVRSLPSLPLVLKPFLCVLAC